MDRNQQMTTVYHPTGNFKTRCYHVWCLHHSVCRQYESHLCVFIMDSINPQWIQDHDGKWRRRSEEEKVI